MNSRREINSVNVLWSALLSTKAAGMVRLATFDGARETGATHYMTWRSRVEARVRIRKAKTHWNRE